MRICVRGYASIANLGPGYDIAALAISNPYDDVLVELMPSGEDKVSFIGTYAKYVPSNFRETTIYPVVERFREITGKSFSVNVTIRKEIKPASGLGSSGADAAAMAYALNKLLNTGLDPQALVKIASLGETVSAGSPHMDNVAASLLGGLVIINPVSGDVVKVRIPEDYWFVIVITGSKVSTGEMRKVVPRNIDIELHKNNAAYASMLIYALLSKDISTLKKALMGDAIVEPARAKFYNHYDSVKNALMKAGAVGVALSGAGPSLFGVFTNEPSRGFLNEVLREHGVKDYLIVISKPSNRGAHEVMC